MVIFENKLQVSVITLVKEKLTVKILDLENQLGISKSQTENKIVELKKNQTELKNSQKEASNLKKTIKEQEIEITQLKTHNSKNEIVKKYGSKKYFKLFI